MLLIRSFELPLVLSQHNAWPVHPAVQVQQTLSQLLTPSAARQGRWVLSALHGLRYSLCAVEFQVLPKGMKGKERNSTLRLRLRKKNWIPLGTGSPPLLTKEFLKNGTAGVFPVWSRSSWWIIEPWICWIRWILQSFTDYKSDHPMKLIQLRTWPHLFINSARIAFILPPC